MGTSGWQRGDPAGVWGSKAAAAACTHTHTRTHIRTHLECVFTYRTRGWENNGEPLGPSDHPLRIPPALGAICLGGETAMNGAPPTPHDGTWGWTGAATAEKREAAPGYTAENEPEPWEGCGMDPGGPRIQAPELCGARTPAPRGARTRSLGSGLGTLALGAWSGGRSRPRARPVGEGALVGNQKPGSRGARTPAPTVCCHRSPKVPGARATPLAGAVRGPGG